MALQVKFPFGKLVSVLVTHVEASGNFFVQINSEAGKLDVLMEQIEHHVLTGRARAPTLSEIMVGSIYLAQYQEDSRWYRSRVLDVNPAEQQCEVFFVDYGNTDFVPLSSMRNAEEKFCELPQQSFECELEGIDRFRSQSFEETVALLNETIVEQELFCKAVQLKKNCVLVTQLFFDEKSTKSVFDQMQSGGLELAAEEHSMMSNGESTLPQQLNRKRQVKYKTMSLPPDSFHDLTVTWVEDPSHFWCQLLTNTRIIAALMENLAEVYTNLEPAALPLQSCTVGYPCCAKFYEDDAWYRGVITNVSSIATGQIEVKFVDYGNSQDTELSDVRDLKDEFLKDPCQAMYFAIAGVDPASKDGMWADEAKVLFEKLINLKHVVGLVTSVEDDGRHRVKLMDTTSDLDMELNQILIAANYGIRSADTPTTTTSTVTALQSSQPATKPMPQPVFGKENVQVGIEEKVLVTNIINPSKFYCQLFKNGPKLESLMQEIGRHYSRLGANEELLSSPSPGDPCCAQFSEDGGWYRAIVMNSSPKVVTVQYIDYGNSETLPLAKIKKLIPKFSDLPQQGIECTLNRIKPSFTAGEPKWKPHDTETFIDLALEKEGKLKVVTQDSSGVCRVELVVRNRREDQNVSEQLLINGNAELADGALPASENYESLKSQTFPEPDLKVGHFEDVIVSYTEHPCNFWCQLQKSATQLDSLMTEIHDLYSCEGQRNSISNPAFGMLCCAQFTEDNKWYRGKITGVKRGGLVEVHFVDYGNYEILPLARVKKLQAQFLKLPPQAVKCALAKIGPTHKDLLSDEVMTRFEELTLDKELVMMADKFNEVSGTFAVVLLDTTEGKNLDIASDLQTIMGPTTMREKVQIMKAQIQPGTTERVFVSSATTPAKFFCQLLKTAASLDELMNGMFEYYESLSPQREQLSEPSVGEFCAAKFSLDDGWYRANVLEVKDNSVSVFYIDYGNSETLSLSRLKVLNSRFQSLPSQAIECSLSGNFKGVSDDKFVELVLEKEFSAKVLNLNGGVSVVDLVSKDTNQSVCDILSGKSAQSTPCNIAQLQWKTGETIDVFVPFAESVQKFFCQTSAHSSELDDLMNRLEECYNTNAEILSTPKAGSLCVAWYDGWYRAKVEQVQGKDVTVNFIDYGDTATVALDNIRTIESEFCLLPAQAVQCCLKGFSATQGLENFKVLVVEQEFKAMVISARSGNVYEVDLVPGDGSASICQRLSKEVEMSAAPSLSVAGIQLKLGEVIDVFIPFAESTQKFFCQVSQNSSDLDDLMTKLEEHYRSDQEIVTSISAGTFCVARYEDGGWYRAQVTGVQGESIDVFYIDYGDSATLPLGSIRSLKPEFSSLPAQAIKCSLKGYSSNQELENFKDLVIEQEFSAQVTCVKTNGYEVQLASKDGSTKFSKELSEERKTTAESTCSVPSIQLKAGDKVDVFIPFVESTQKFFCQVSQSSSDLDDLMNKLEEHYSLDQEIVTSISVGTFCVARYEDGGWYRAQVTGVQGESIDVFYIDYGDSATLPLSSIRSLKPEFSSLPAQAIKCSLKGYSSNQELENFKDLVIEQEFSAQVTCVKTNGYEVQLASKDGSTKFSKELSEERKTTAESTCSVPSIQLKAGDKVDVFIPFVESTQKFFCQVSQSSSDLDDLMNKLEEHYSLDQEIVTSISVGTFCVARYEDGGWYRAQVTGVQGESIDVFYIDYGDSATLPLSSIRSLKPEFSSLPAQAIKCSLKGYSSNQELENFKDLVIEQEFSAQVTCVKTNGYEVQLASKDGSALFRKELSEEMKTTTEFTCSVPSIQLKAGDQVDVFIPFVESTQKFFCQVSQSSSDLDDLMNRLEEHYSLDQEIVTSISAGTFCVARYEDGGWYRAQVTGGQGESIDVFYIDYGDSATLPLSSIRTLKVEFSSLPAQAVKCSLKGYSSNRGPENFKDLVIEQEFEAQVTSVITQNTYEVELVSKDGNASFISKTLAKDVETTQEPPCDVPSIQLKPGDKVDVFIPFVESAQKFFGQVSQNSSELDNLMNKLEEHYSSVQESMTSVSAGSFCVAQYEDGGWYRAQVTQVQGESIDVFYIDYGDAATLPHSSIRSLRPNFSLLPAQAIKCHLKGCSTNDQPENFKDLVLEQEFQLQVTGSHQPGVYEVELFSKEGSKLFGETLPSKAKNKEIGPPILSGINVGSFIQLCPTAFVSPHQFHCHAATPEHKEKLSQLMDNLQEHYEAVADQEPGLANPVVGMNCAALFPDDEMWYRGRITKVVDDQFVEVFYVDFGNSETVPVSKVKTIKEEWAELPAQAIQCSLASISPVGGPTWPDAVVARFKNLTIQKMLVGKVIKKGSDNILEIDLFDTAEQSVDINIGDLLVKEGLAIRGTSKPVAAVKSYAALGKAKPAETEKVYVSALESPGCFFCLVSGTEEKLMALMSEISSVYDSLSEEEFALSAISVGDVCCAQFSEDNQWYRAVVEDDTNGELTVRFIDYGNTETLPISRAKILKDAFFAEPPLAVKCSLLGIKPAVGETWPDESGALFEELTSEKELNAKFSSFTEPFEIQLNESGVDIGEELVRAKLAVSTQTSVEPIAQGKPASRQYTNPVVECGEMYDVVMTHLSSPGKFFCQLVDMKEQLEGMMTDLNDYYFQLAETEGCLVSPTVGQPCVAVFEEMWYRAEVRNISVNDMSVHYVDYGNEETLKPSEVKQITPLFLKTPKVAIECSLDLNRDEWPEDSTGIFEELTASDEQLIIKTLRCQGGRYEVKVFNKDASCYSAEVLGTLKGAAQEVTLKEQALQLGQTEDVYVVHTESSEDFYIQLSATYPQLEQLMAKIAEVYSGLADDIGHEDVVIGNPVCAQFSEDDSWYRAAIKSVPSDFEVEVHYVDYGNSEVILLSDVRQLSKRFFNLPVQAVRCCLDSPLVESFGQRVADKELKATFLSFEKGKWKVSLFDGVGKVGQIDVPQDADDTFLVREFIQPVITPEMKERVYVSHVVSPDDFYVQFESALDDLSALSGELSRFYLPLGPSTNVLRSPSPGMSCCARFSQDADWYRGRIKRVTSSGAEVEFVDYGNSEVVSFDQVKDPEKNFMQLPQQAILCGLDATKDHWSAGEVNIFKSVALDKSFNAKFIIRDGQKWRVSLDSGGVSIVDMFMTKDAADLQQEGRGISSVQVGRYAFTQVSSGQIEEVYVSHVTESGDFYIQLSKSSADLETIENLVSEIYDQIGSTAEAMEMCFVDSLCCARFSEDFKWYRALVTKVFSDTEVEVLFVDYGNTDSLQVGSMKQLRPELLKFPVQAVKCRLEGSKDIWTESDVQQFESKVLERPLHVTFTRQEGATWFVTIQELDMFSSKARLTSKGRSFSKETLDVNKREEAYFLFANSPDCFWLNLVRTGDDLVRLMDQIANAVTDQPLEKSHVKVGVPCLGMYTENDMWHRAQIVEVQDDAYATVSYIDYGSSETLPLERLHAISDSQLKLPSQGICCRLAGVQGVDPNKITNYLNEMLVEKVVEFEVQDQHADGSYTVKLFRPGASQSINDQIVGECLGDTSLVDETKLEQASPPRLPATQERIAFKLPELQSGSKVPVSFVSAFLPAEMQLLLTERTEEQEQLTESITSMYNKLSENELRLDNAEVGMLCCVHFSEKWYRGEIISISADGTASVKLVDCGTHEKIPISELRSLKDELLQPPVFVLESSLANIHPSAEDGQWSPECSTALESLCRSKALVAEITQVFGDMVELILSDDSGKQINQSLIEMGYAKACDPQEDFSGEQPSLKWPELQIGQSLDAYFMAAKDLESIQLQLDDPDAGLSTMMDQLSVLYSNLSETEEVVGNPRVGQVCCAQFSEDEDWYRAVVTCVSEAGVEVKFVDYGNIDVALMVKQLREEFFSLPVQCMDCSLHGVESTSEKNEEIAAKLSELCESKKLKAEITNVSGDSVEVNLFYECGETLESVADVLVKLGCAHPRPTVQEQPRRISISEGGKMVYNYPESGDDFVHNVSLISTSSPSDFWCQLVDSMSELKTLSDKIELFYQSLGENDLRFLCLQVGDTCCAQFTDDNKWCRSQVTKVCSDGQVCVRSVDYVKQETLTLDRIKKLDPGCAVLPVQVLCCSLAGIEPPHKYYEEDWSSDVVGRFQELCQGKDVKIKIKETVGDVTLVDLLDSTGLSIANQLLVEGLAVEVKSPLTETPVEDVLQKQDCLSSEREGVVDKDSSEENDFEEALSSIEGVEALMLVEGKTEIEDAKGGEDEDDNEEEFLDSNDQVIEDVTEVSEGHEYDEEGVLHTTEEDGQAVKNEEDKQDDENELKSAGEQEEQTMKDAENNEEEDDNRFQVTDKQEMRTVESDEKTEEEGGGKLQAANILEDMEAESDEKKQEGRSVLQATEEPKEQAVEEIDKTPEDQSGPQTTEEQQVQTLESDQNEQGGDELHSTEEQGEQAVKEDEIKQESESGPDQTAEEIQGEERSEDLSSPVPQSELEEVDAEDAKEVTKEVECSKSKEQAIHGEVPQEETEAQTGQASDLSKDVECLPEEKVNDTDTSEAMGDAQKSAKEEDEGPKMEEVSEEKERRIDEQEKEFVEPEDVLTEAFSEEDLSAITGSAGETEAEILDVEKAEEERLTESNIKEVVKQSSEAEESVKVFLEELLSDVCGSIDKQKSEYMESANKCDAEAQDILKIPIATEPEDSASSNADCCDDVDDNVLSDEALDKLDKELEAESSYEIELGVNRTGDMLNGPGEEEIHQVVKNGQDTECQTGISDCLDSKLSVMNGNSEEGNF